MNVKDILGKDGRTCQRQLLDKKTNRMTSRIKMEKSKKDGKTTMAWWEKVGKSGNSFQGNLTIWWKTMNFQINKYIKKWWEMLLHSWEIQIFSSPEDNLTSYLGVSGQEKPWIKEDGGCVEKATSIQLRWGEVMRWCHPFLPCSYTNLPLSPSSNSYCGKTLLVARLISL